MRITHLSTRLSDRSKVYDLQLSIGSEGIKIRCISAADACHLAEKIGAAIDKHSVESTITYAYAPDYDE